MSDQINPAEITSDDKLWALLCYIFPILAHIIVLLMQDKKDRPYIKIHFAQSLVYGILASLLSAVCIGLIMWLVAIYWGIKAYQGEAVEIPVITDFCKNQGWV